MGMVIKHCTPVLPIPNYEQVLSHPANVLDIVPMVEGCSQLSLKQKVSIAVAQDTLRGLGEKRVNRYGERVCKKWEIQEPRKGFTNLKSETRKQLNNQSQLFELYLHHRGGVEPRLVIVAGDGRAVYFMLPPTSFNELTTLAVKFLESDVYRGNLALAESLND